MTEQRFEGYPIDEALHIAIDANYELVDLLDGIEILHVVSGAGGSLPYGHPNLAVFIAANPLDAQMQIEEIMRRAAPLVERGIRVAVYPQPSK